MRGFESHWLLHTYEFTKKGSDDLIAKGCTCDHSFTIPYAQGDIVAIVITYQQKGITKVEKTIDDCTFEDGKVQVHLSQEDTLKFEDDAIIKMQIRIRLNSGLVTKSGIVETYTDNALNNEVI